MMMMMMTSEHSVDDIQRLSEHVLLVLPFVVLATKCTVSLTVLGLISTVMQMVIRPVFMAVECLYDPGHMLRLMSASTVWKLYQSFNIAIVNFLGVII